MIAIWKATLSQSKQGVETQNRYEWNFPLHIDIALQKTYKILSDDYIKRSPMPVTDQDIKRIATLGSIAPADNLDKQREDFNNLIGLFDQIKDIDIQDIAPLDHPIEHATAPLREDSISEHDDHTYYQKIAPSVEAGVYLVPPAIPNSDDEDQ